MEKVNIGGAEQDGITRLQPTSQTDYDRSETLRVPPLGREGTIASLLPSPWLLLFIAE